LQGSDLLRREIQAITTGSTQPSGDCNHVPFRVHTYGASGSVASLNRRSLHVFVRKHGRTNRLGARDLRRYLRRRSAIATKSLINTSSASAVGAPCGQALFLWQAGIDGVLFNT